jgi:hypothetical protein
MDYFDASEEFHNSIQEFVSVHDGKLPERAYLAPSLYEWLTSMRREESVLQGQDPESVDVSVFHSEIGPLKLVVDEHLSDYDIVLE